MSEQQYKYNCGCGFKTDNLAEATLHVEQTGHTMQIGGVIKPSN